MVAQPCRTDGSISPRLFKPGIKPQKVYFPRRNRIIAAFSDEIIITSTGKGSGALITAQYGEKYHRKIWIITNDRKSSV